MITAEQKPLQEIIGYIAPYARSFWSAATSVLPFAQQAGEKKWGFWPLPFTWTA